MICRKLSADMEATRVALDKEHQLKILQMEAINALWKKVSSSISYLRDYRNLSNIMKNT